MVFFFVVSTIIVIPTTSLAIIPRTGAINTASTPPRLHTTSLHAEAATTKRQYYTRDWKDGENNNTSLASRLFFTYANPLLDIASHRRLQISDAFHVPESRIMDRAVTRLENVYERCRARAREKKSTFNNKKKQIATSESVILGMALLQSQKNTLLLTGILRLCNTIVQSFPSLLVARLLRQIESGTSIRAMKPLQSAIMLVSVLSMKMLLENQFFHNIVKCSCDVRGSISGLIFDKSLRLSANGGGGGGGGGGAGTRNNNATITTTSNFGSGSVLNLMQSDVTIIEMLTLQLHTLWDGLLQISIYTALLYRFLGTPVLLGVMVLLTTIPLNAITLRILNRLNLKETVAKDERMKKTTESIVNMTLLKLLVWENTFANGIQGQRDLELRKLKQRGSIRALNTAISNAVPTITLVVTLSAFAKTGRPIVASTIFTAISLFNQLRFPLLFYPMLIDSMANGKNSLQRISSYLSQDEIASYVERRDRIDGVAGGIEMDMTNGSSFVWARAGKSGMDGVPALYNASISVGPGEIVAIVGDVGSGKTALVKSLIGELSPVQGRDSLHMPRVLVHGSIAYCAQEAWLPKGTIRESVVFGRDYNEQRYLRAIFDAGLDGDISVRGTLNHDTDVGEDGSMLSGGQRSRVALARALYDEDAGVFILDDPLSALDASVSSTVFERVSSRLRRDRVATLFVTNDPNLPRNCDKVIIMGYSGSSSGSRIVDIGTYDELKSRGHDLNSIVHPEERTGVYGNAQKIVNGINVFNDTAISSSHADLVEHAVPQPIESSLSGRSNQFQLSTDDSMSTGAVRLSTYKSYFKSVKSPILIAGAVAAYLISNGCQFFQQLTIARWTDAGGIGGTMAATVTAKYLNQLILATVMISVSMYFRSYLTMRVGVRASSDVHQKMLHSVFKAPLSFFSRTPSGQLLTRFGKELDVVDRSLPDGIASVMYCTLQILFSIIALAGVVSPLLVVPIGTVAVFYIDAMSRFRPAARDLKRCESKSRSPIYTQFREALRGIETIRSIPNGQRIWSNKHRSLIDENISVFYSVKALDRWLSVRLESLGNAVVLTAAIGSVFLSRAGKLKSGAAGWGLTQALSITGLLTWAVRTLTDAETQFLSVERLSELINLEIEEIKSNSIVSLSHDNEVALINSGWPVGRIQFNDVSMRYTPASSLVLKKVSVNVPAGSTLGVVGRTGSGKSSLLLTLFRLVEIEEFGSISIDGVDIRALSLQGLRGSLSIIPQSPTLFAGTLLYNLDSSGKTSAEDAWRALEASSSELARQFRDLEGLDTIITEGGMNLSQGQRQLICLARALVKRSNILVLDEATSSVDPRTDAQVQETILREFVQKGVTVITVAHRLDTVLGYDKILVLDAGKVVEYGSPGELLKTDGYLRRLYDADQLNRLQGTRQKLTTILK